MAGFFHDTDIPRHYRMALLTSLRGAIRFAERRQEILQSKGKPRVAVTLTPAEGEALLIEQDYRCALTRLMFNSCSGGSYGPSRMSLDRLQHKGPYSAGNVRIIMLGVNSFRGAGSDADMYQIAQALVGNMPTHYRL